MPEQIAKLTPDRDLQCYFLTPSAVAAMSGASTSGFVLSGKWRQQFDWAVVEWNRDNVFEHPSLRNLPDGDLSGITLSYQEERVGCIPTESNLVPTVDWDNLRIWAYDNDGVEQLYHVELWPSRAVPVEGNYVPASATMTLVESPGTGQRVGLAFLGCHHYWTVNPNDSLSDIALGLAQDIQSNSDFTATSSGNSVTVTWKAGPVYGSLVGANGNRIGIYGTAQNGSPCWQNTTSLFSGGEFPSKYRVTLDFGKLKSELNIPTDKVRKLRWTWSADLQAESFSQTEFSVTVSNWEVSGVNTAYSFAGPGSRRIQSPDSALVYSGTWNQESGNFSGGDIRVSLKSGDSIRLSYSEASTHDLYVGTRLLNTGGALAVMLDGKSLGLINQALPGEDILVRSRVLTAPSGPHELILTNAGPDGSSCYFNFVEIVYPSQSLPDYQQKDQLSLATDWDTYHSQSLPAERTAWLIHKLGFAGRVNHYVGALWFCELQRAGTQYAKCTVSVPDFTYVADLAASLSISPVVTDGLTPIVPTQIQHLVLPDDSKSSVAEALAALVNLGTNLIWAYAVGSQLTLIARAMGVLGNGITIHLELTTPASVTASNEGLLSGGIEGTPYELDESSSLSQPLISAANYWKADTATDQPINRAARDWHYAFFQALKGYGLDVVAAFSTELLNADPSVSAGLAQRYPDGSPVVLNTPAIQTNFSPTSLNYWTKTYLSMAAIQADAGLTPYLQSGEVQWWYFSKQRWDSVSGSNVDVGMAFYDAYTLQQFEAEYGSAMQVIVSNSANPSIYPRECAFLPGMIGSFTKAIRQALKSAFPGCRYEVLYPTDTNDTPLNKIVNYPTDDWTPENLTCLKTESFTFTGNCNLDLALQSIETSSSKGFLNSARSHLVGIGTASTPWTKEANIALAQGLESVVLFALDQFCLIGYSDPAVSTAGTGQRRY